MSELAVSLGRAAMDRRVITQLSIEHPELDLATAYRVQRELRSTAGPLAGWKLGMTSPAKQAQVGLTDPIYGFLAAAASIGPGERLDTSLLIHPRCEPEIVFTLAHELEDPHVTAANVIAASSSVAIGIEVLDSRYADYRFTMTDVIADNTSAARYVVGTPVSPQDIDLRLVGVILEKNGTVVATATGAAALGHPAAAVAWLARQLSATGESLRAGEIVFSGGLTAAVPVGPGDVVTASIDRLGSLELSCF